MAIWGALMAGAGLLNALEKNRQIDAMEKATPDQNYINIMQGREAKLGPMAREGYLGPIAAGALSGMAASQGAAKDAAETDMLNAKADFYKGATPAVSDATVVPDAVPAAGISEIPNVFNADANNGLSILNHGSDQVATKIPGSSFMTPNPPNMDMNEPYSSWKLLGQRGAPSLYQMGRTKNVME